MLSELNLRTAQSNRQAEPESGDLRGKLAIANGRADTSALRTRKAMRRA